MLRMVAGHLQVKDSKCHMTCEDERCLLEESVKLKS